MILSVFTAIGGLFVAFVVSVLLMPPGFLALFIFSALMLFFLVLSFKIYFWEPKSAWSRKVLFIDELRNFGYGDAEARPRVQNAIGNTSENDA